MSYFSLSFCANLFLSQLGRKIFSRKSFFHHHGVFIYFLRFIYTLPQSFEIMFDYGNGIQNHAVWYCLDFYVPLNGYYWDDMIYLLYTDHNLFIEPKPISNIAIMKILKHDKLSKYHRISFLQIFSLNEYRMKIFEVLL